VFFNGGRLLGLVSEDFQIGFSVRLLSYDSFSFALTFTMNRWLKKIEEEKTQKAPRAAAEGSRQLIIAEVEAEIVNEKSCALEYVLDCPSSFCPLSHSPSVLIII